MDKTKLTKEQITAEWIKAVGEMIEYYEGKNDKYRTQACPFCRIARPDGCRACLWHIFEGKTCHQVEAFVIDMRITRKEAWVAKSLPRLRRWGRRLSKSKPI